MRRYLRAQDAACKHTATPATVCYTDDPLVSESLKGNADYCKTIGVNVPPSELVLKNSVPDLQSLGKAAAVYPKFDVAQGPSVFLHQCRSPGGNERLVSIWIKAATAKGDDGSYDISLHTEVLTLATSATPPAIARWDHIVTLRRWSTNQALTLYAGQPDPSDASHFTIPIDFRGQRRVVDGCLCDDDTVALDPHLGCVTSVAPRTYDEVFGIDEYAEKQVTITTPALKFPNNPSPDAPPTYTSCAFTPDGTKLATGECRLPLLVSDATQDTPGRIHLIDLKTGQPVPEFQCKAAAIAPVAMTFSPDGAYLATMGNAGSIELWNAATGDDLGTVGAGWASHRFQAMHFDPKGSPIIYVTGGLLGSWSAFSLPDLKFLHTDPAPPLKPATITLQPNGRKYPTYRDDMTNPAPNEFRKILEDGRFSSRQSPGATSGASPNGRWLAWGGDGVSVLDTQSLVIIHRSIHPDKILWQSAIFGFAFAVFSPDGRFLLSAVDGGGFCIWPMPDCSTVCEIATNTDVIFVAFSPDSKRVATIDDKQELDVWDLPAPPATGG